MEPPEGQPQFDEWAVIELMGHQRMAGHVTQAPIGGMLRIDVYDGKDEVLYTRFVNPKAIYAINPTSKEVAIAVGEDLAQPPVSRWDVQKLLPEPEPDAAPAAVVEDGWDDDVNYYGDDEDGDDLF